MVQTLVVRHRLDHAVEHEDGPGMTGRARIREEVRPHQVPASVGIPEVEAALFELPPVHVSFSVRDNWMVAAKFSPWTRLQDRSRILRNPRPKLTYWFRLL